MNRPTPIKWLEPFRLREKWSALDYEVAFTPPLPRRTALNRLKQLRDAGLIDRHGDSRATIYQLTEAGRATLGSDQSSQSSESPARLLARLSTAAEEVRRTLRQPASVRPAVGYQRSFLDAYFPNETHYLPDPVRRRLFEIGCQTGMEAEPAGTYARHICQRLLIDLSWNSSRLEGNTYSLLETEQLLQAGFAGDTQLWGNFSFR